MKTDAQFFRIFQIQPNLVNLLLENRPEFDYSYKAETIKGLERQIDGVFYPEDSSAPILILEVQGYRQKDVYHRLLESVAGLSRRHNCRPTHGAVLFLRREYDPKTKPFYELSRSGVIWFQALYLEEARERLMQREPNHPLVALLFPLFAGGNDRFKKAMRNHYRTLADAKLAPEVKDVYLNVFISWTMARFKKKSREEVFKMLGIQEELESSLAYREIKAEGRTEGLMEGRVEGRMEGREEGLIEGEIKALDKLWAQNVLAEKQYLALVEPLRVALAELRARRKQGGRA